MTEEVRLHWNKHQHTIMSVFNSFYQRESLVDVTLAADGKYIHVHRLVLSACSTYFEELLNLQPEKHPIIFLKDVSFCELKQIVDFMYKGEVGVEQHKLSQFVAVARSLKIKGLTGEEEEDPETLQNDDLLVVVLEQRENNGQNLVSKISPGSQCKSKESPTKDVRKKKRFKGGQFSSPGTVHTDSQCRTETSELLSHEKVCSMEAEAVNSVVNFSGFSDSDASVLRERTLEGQHFEYGGEPSPLASAPYSDSGRELGRFVIVEGATKANKSCLVDRHGFRFTVRNRATKNTIWRCAYRPRDNSMACKATVREVEGHFFPGPREHNHSAKPDLLGAIQFSAELKSKATEEASVPASKIVKAALMAHCTDLGTTNTLPSVTNLIRRANRIRQHKKSSVSISSPEC